MDYRLDSLSTRTFEHLIQALALQAVSDTVMPFGDGPDGGREATFNGQTRYGQPIWNGFGIIQAKFKQKPSSTTAVDGKWAIKELTKELRQFTKKRSKRTLPQYYIFATNVVLTPQAGGGTKDQLKAILDEFQLKHGLVEYDIWDYDKLRVLIDNNKNVRESYAAWITPGDVLSRLADTLGRHHIDHYKLMTNFLQKELLQDRYARLEQAGHSNDDPIPLSQVFIDLPVTASPDGSDEDRQINFASRIIEAAGNTFSQLQVSSLRTEQLQQRGETVAVGRYVLIGGPGQGKTTLGQFICQIFRTALLEDVPPERVDPSVRLAMDDIAGQWGDGTLTRPNARRLPFRIVLSEFAKKLANDEANGIIDYLAKYVGKRTETTLRAADLRLVLQQYPSIIVLDGLDEVPASSNRDEVLQAVRNFLVDVASDSIDVLILATTRPQGYNDDFSPKHYVHLYLAPLQPRIALTYARRLTRIRFGQEPDRQEKIMDRLGRAARSNATARLMRSPLQVTIMALLVDRMGQPPQERWALFNEYYKLIYQREIERDIPAASVLRDFRPDIDAIHRQVGIVLQLETERSGGTDARLEAQQFARLVRDYLENEGHSGTGLERLSTEIIDAAANRLVFLVGLEAGLVGFEIRSLQEFMAAEGLMEPEDGIVQRRLREIAPIANWRNVFLFAAGKCFAERRYLRDTIGQICAELNESSNSLMSITQAGSYLALELLEDGSVLKQPNFCRTLTRLALKLLQVDDVEYVRRIAGIYQDLNSAVFAEEVSNLMKHGSEMVRSNTRMLIVKLADLHNIEVSEFQIVIEEWSDWTYDGLRNLVRLATGQPGPIQTLIAAGMRRLPITDTLTLLDGGYLTWRSDSAPGLTRALKAVSGSYRNVRQRRVRLLGSRRLAIGSLLLTSIDQPRLESLQGAAAVESERPDWRAFASALAFVRSPSARLLKDVLASVSSSTTQDRPVLYLGLALPWPLQRALYDAEVHGWRSIIESVNSGDYGDTRVWREFEEEIDPITNADYMLGSNVRAAFASVDVPKTARAVNEFVEFAAKYFGPQLPIQCLWALVDAIGALPAGSVPEAVDMCLRSAAASGFWYPVINLLSHVDPDSIDRSVWQALLQQVGPVAFHPHQSFDIKKLLRIARREWDESPSPDLLSVFAFLAQFPSIATAEIPDPGPDRYEWEELDHRQRLSLVALQIAKGARLPDLQERILQVAVEDKLAVRTMIAVATKVETQDLRISRLVDLHQIASKAGSNIRTHAELKGLADKEVSRFVDERMWAELAFPIYLRPIIMDHFVKP